MLSFCSIILLAAATFATIASAIPAAPPSHNTITRDDGVGDLLDLSLRDLDLEGYRDYIIDIDISIPHVKKYVTNRNLRIAGPAMIALTKRGRQKSPGDVFKTCSDGVEDIVHKIGQY